MKKVFNYALLLLMMVVVSTSLTSCGDDEEEAQTEEPTDANYSSLLPGFWGNTDEDEDLTGETFAFDSEGNISYQYEYYPNDDEYEIIASGTYTVNGTVLTAKYTTVYVYTSTGAKTYNGFTKGTSRTVTYTIISCDGKTLVIKNGSKTLTFEKYKDL